ncbi:helix-turn-helix domain-containing protein [Nostoc sp. CHAB 5714]|uniref:Helix-turn-helix domain-containing protein n=1 Tax=Nostoc favosum CHAB5714 TaxID=2780399 RepID=A0ABS8IAN7_9NOSO|nr:helix-turn-helix domain-containing protein [Nostoc favosum CHAB5714]
MLWWIKSGQVKEQQEIGKRLARDTSTVTRWLQKYKTDGLSGLLEIKKAPGAKRKIDDAAIAALEEELKVGKYNGSSAPFPARVALTNGIPIGSRVASN